jgi:hypothetical protein
MTVVIRVLAVLAAVVVTSSTAHAAPWSFELPAGYTEVPGAADEQLARLRKVVRTVSADAQVYVSPDGRVRLTRMTWLSKFDVTPTRGGIEKMDRELSAGNGKAGTIVSESRELVGEQLLGEQVVDIGELRADMRRLYAADREQVVTMFTVICAGAKDALGDCERAQQTMRLELPNQASISGAAPEASKLPYVLGALGGAAVLGVLIWLWWRRRR